MCKAYEVAFAGGVSAKYTKAWFIRNSLGGYATGSFVWWTMSPSTFSSANNMARVYNVGGSNNPGHLVPADSGQSGRGVRPVLSLKSCVTWTEGDGTHTNPYKVSLSSACASAEN